MIGKRKRQKVLERNGYQCVMCGMSNKEHKEKYGEALTIHHKNRDKTDNSMDNLITLCVKCHGRLHKDQWNEGWEDGMKEAFK